MNKIASGACSLTIAWTPLNSPDITAAPSYAWAINLFRQSNYFSSLTTKSEIAAALRL